MIEQNSKFLGEKVCDPNLQAVISLKTSGALAIDTQNDIPSTPKTNVQVESQFTEKTCGN